MLLLLLVVVVVVVLEGGTWRVRLGRCVSGVLGDGGEEGRGREGMGGMGEERKGALLWLDGGFVLPRLFTCLSVGWKGLGGWV